MITRQDLFNALFKLKEAGIEVQPQLDLLKSESGVPKEVVKFLQDQSPLFQFYRHLQKHQRALMRNILHYDELDTRGKIKICSSLITRAMIAVEYNNIHESLLDELKLSELSGALHRALSDYFYDDLDSVLESYRQSMRLFYKGHSNPIND